MRPIELTLDGFRSYDRPTTFRWSGRGLVGVVGPIGSGKSSILDGISFALYGRTPRIGRSVRTLINQRRDQATVTFTFSVDAVTLRVVRSLRRTGQSAHALYRIDGSEQHEEADKAGDVTERVVSVLGLDFEGFRKSVMLAQGQFAAFLEAGPAERSDVLKGVFGLERLDAMRTAAVQHRQEAAAVLQALDAARAALATDRTALEDARQAAAQAEQRAAALLGLLPASDALEERAAQARTAKAQAAAAIERLDALAEEVPRRKDTDALLDASRAAGASVAAAAEAAAAAAAAVGEAEQELADALSAAGGQDALDEAGVLIGVVTQQRQAAREAAEKADFGSELVERRRIALAAANDVAAGAEQAAARARAATETAVVVRGEAERTLHEARHRSMALTLRADLVAGDTCPVCGQAVAAVPAEETPPAVIEAESALSEARARESDAARGAAAAEADLAVARAGVESGAAAVTEGEEAAAQAAAARERAAADLEATLAALERLLGPGDPEALLAKRRAALAQAAARLAAARERAVTAEQDRAAASAAASEADRSVHGLVGKVAELAGRLEVRITVTPDADVLDAALGDVRSAWLDRRRQADEALSAAEAEAAAVASERLTLLSGADIDPDADPRMAVGEAAAAAEAAHRRVTDIEARLSRLTEMEAAEADTIALRDRYARLAEDLARAKFPAYVLEDRRRMLADLGGDLFEALSGGRYRFSDDGEFDVVDLAAAEQVRSADSLSGGESFLASLGLALALAEIVAREGGRLDAFFLDEGFGSLDPEHLGLAMDGVERLAAMGDRLVVVVSHVEALRDRIEDLVVLDKDPLTGATRVVQGASGPE